MLDRCSRFLFLLAAFCGMAITPTRCFSQNAVSGTVLGTVLDASGAAVAGAAVALENVANGVNYQAQTNDSGNYTFTNVQPGNYTITVTNTGFQKYVQQSVGVQVSQSTRVDASLGFPSSFARFAQVSTTQEDRQNRSYSFIQDSWRITPKLTLNLGVRNSLRGPHFFQADWQVAKGFKFSERVGLEIRWDVFNVFNTTNLALPATTINPGAGGGIISDIQTGPTSMKRNMMFGAHITF